MSMIARAGETVPAEPPMSARGLRPYRMPAKVLHWITAILVFCMVASGVIAKQLGEGPVCDLLFSLHKLTGAVTLFVVIARLLYRAWRAIADWDEPRRRRPLLHWTLYTVVVLVPLLGWAGISDFGAREVFPGVSLPQIWPEGLGYDELLLRWHAYFAFALLAIVALHIGVAIQDYMTDRGADPREAR